MISVGFAPTTFSGPDAGCQRDALLLSYETSVNTVWRTKYSHYKYFQSLRASDRRPHLQPLVVVSAVHTCRGCCSRHRYLRAIEPSGC